MVEFQLSDTASDRSSRLHGNICRCGYRQQITGIFIRDLGRSAAVFGAANPGIIKSERDLFLTQTQSFLS